MAQRVAELPLLRRLVLVALRPNLARAELERLADEARQHDCLALAVHGSRLELVADRLAESRVKVAALVGFPFGAMDSDVKRFEVEAALDAGAQEIHAVVNHGRLKDRNDAAFVRELRDLREAADERPFTAILEMGLLTAEEADRAVQLARDAEVQFVASATGCAARPTSVEDVLRLREAAGPDLGLTAVGGINGPAEAQALVDAGANRLGVFALAPFAPSE